MKHHLGQLVYDSERKKWGVFIEYTENGKCLVNFNRLATDFKMAKELAKEVKIRNLEK